MRKVLLVSHVSGFIPQFEMNNVRILQQMGCEVHYASNFRNPSYGEDNHRLEGTGIVCHQVDFVRTPYSLTNVRAYHQLRRLMAEHDFALVHCHNPMSAAITRLAARATHTAPVIYTAHGFHFYQGAPLHMWLLYGTMEWLLSFLTCQQICINKEDYAFSKKHFHCRRVDYVPGVGIDLAKIRGAMLLPDETAGKRAELGVSEDAFLLVTAGEMIPRKNQTVLLDMMDSPSMKNTVLLICGHGELDRELKKKARDLHLEDRVLFPGYREDLYEIYSCADLFVFPSFQEGLPVALLEAMACGLPAVCSDIRGNRELIAEGKGGFRRKPEDAAGFRSAVLQLLRNRELCSRMGAYNSRKVEEFSADKVSGKMRQIYRWWLAASCREEREK